MLAVAVADGTVMMYQWQDPSNLTSHNEYRSIKVLNNAECTCLSWNPAFDEPMSLVVGCLVITTKSSLGEAEQIEQEVDMNMPKEVNLL